MELTYTLTEGGVYTAQAEDSSGTYTSSAVSDPVTYRKWLKINGSYVSKIQDERINTLNGESVWGGVSTYEYTQSGSTLNLTNAPYTQSGSELTIG